MRTLTRVSGSFDHSHHVVHICLVQFIANVQKDLSGKRQNITKDNTLISDEIYNVSVPGNACRFLQSSVYTNVYFLNVPHIIPKSNRLVRAPEGY